MGAWPAFFGQSGSGALVGQDSVDSMTPRTTGGNANLLGALMLGQTDREGSQDQENALTAVHTANPSGSRPHRTRPRLLLSCVAALVATLKHWSAAMMRRTTVNLEVTRDRCL